MKNKDLNREIVKVGIQKHLLGATLKEVSVIHDRFFKDNRSGVREKVFVKHLTMVSIRNRGIIEHVISKYLKRPLPKKNTQLPFQISVYFSLFSFYQCIKILNKF